MKSVLILGAGVAGCATAFELKKLGFAVSVIEAGANPGGGVWTNNYALHPYTFGPRVFFTRDEGVIKHITSLIKMREFITKTCTFVERDGSLYNYPIQRLDIENMPDKERVQQELSMLENLVPSTENFEAYWLSAIGPSLYSKFIDEYSKKMWGIQSNKQLSANFEWVNRGTPIRDGDTRLYTDQYQGYPEEITGFNNYLLKCLQGIDTRFETPVVRLNPDKREVHIRGGEVLSADIIINTVHVDRLFSMEYGELQYCGRDFIPIWLPVKNALPEDLTWIHYSGIESHTRVTEFKKITGYKSDSTLLGVEIPSKNGRYYPVQSQPELKRFEQYKNLFPKDFYSIGRMGKFQYQGIPDAIRDALNIAEMLK